MPKKPINTSLKKGGRTPKIIRPLGDPQRSSAPTISTVTVDPMAPPGSMQERAEKARLRRNGAY